MKKSRYTYGCVLGIGSMTQSIRAQKILASAAIRSELIKPDPSQTGGGCSWGVLLPCVQEQNAEEILRAEGIRIRSRYRGEEK